MKAVVHAKTSKTTRKVWIKVVIHINGLEANLIEIRGNATYYLRKLFKAINMGYDKKEKSWHKAFLPIRAALDLVALLMKAGFEVREVCEKLNIISYYMEYEGDIGELEKFAENVAAKIEEIKNSRKSRSILTSDVVEVLGEFRTEVPLPKRTRMLLWLLEQLNEDLGKLDVGIFAKGGTDGRFVWLAEMLIVRYLYRLLKIYPEFDAVLHEAYLGIYLLKKSRFGENKYYTRWYIMFKRPYYWFNTTIIITKDKKVYDAAVIEGKKYLNASAIFELKNMWIKPNSKIR